MSQTNPIISPELLERISKAAVGQGVSPEDYLTGLLNENAELPPHRRELVERFLAWWEGDRSNLGCAVKLAVAKLAGIEWVIPEIEAQRPAPEE